MFPNGIDKNGPQFCCAVKKRARERARYHREMQTPEGYARRKEKWDRQSSLRRGDPVYDFQKRMYESVRIRVR